MAGTDSTIYSESVTIGYVYAAFAMVIFYDYVLCIEQEINLFWRKKIFGAPLIFLANRYTLLMYGVGCALQVPLWTRPMACEAIDLVFYIANMLLFAIAGIFAALRVYAISNRNKVVGIGVLTVGMAPAVVNLYTTVAQSYAYIGVDGICSRNRHYTFNSANILDAVACICAVLTDLIVIIVTWHRTYGLWRQGLRRGVSTPLVSLILRDGVLYFITMLSVNVLELVVVRLWVNASSASVAYTSYILVPISPILISRFLVDLHKIASQDFALQPRQGGSGCAPEGSTYGQTLTSIGGNIGAGLRFATPPASTDDYPEDERLESDDDAEEPTSGVDHCEPQKP